MKKLLYIFIILCLSSCVSQAPSVKKHSFETRAGKKKLLKYNNLYNGADKVYDYRVKKTKKTNKKAGYKPK
jgi:hypothetical protein